MGHFLVDVYIPEVGATPQIVAETGDFEIEDASGNLITVSSLDQSSGEYLSGTTLSAPEGAAVVTPMTTLVAEALPMLPMRHRRWACGGGIR